MINKGEGKRCHYFQTIARHFFEHRGAPFFLSSKELDLLARWEKMGIPLRVVLEGMRRSMEASRFGSKKRKKIFSLSYCDSQVLKAFQQYKDRKVGKSERIKEREEKKKKVKAEVDRFLKTVPSRVIYLRDIYSQARMVLSRKDFLEEELERLEEEIEELLFLRASDQEKERVKNELRREYGNTNEEDLASIWKIKLVKFLREEYKIPYISLFFY